MSLASLRKHTSTLNTTPGGLVNPFYHNLLVKINRRILKIPLDK